MKIVVSGANGQVGYELEKLGSSFGFILVALGRDDFDITDDTSIRHVFAEHNPDLIINAAAYTAVDKAESETDLAFLVNDAGSANLAQACLNAQIPLFHISTDYVFDGSLDRPYAETDSVNPQGVYARSKEAGEQRIRALLRQHIILRTSWVFGEQGNNFVKTMMRLGRDRDQLSVVSDQLGGPTSARAIADTLLKLVRKLEAEKALSWGTYHFSQLPYVSWCEFAEEIFSIREQLGIGSLVRVNPIPSSAYPTPVERPKNSRLDCSKLKNILGSDLHQNWKSDLTAVIKRNC